MCVMTKNHSSFGVIYQVDEKEGQIKVLVLQTKSSRGERWVFPGGKMHGVETFLETLRREVRQECAKNWRDAESFHVEFTPEPLGVFDTEKDEGDGIHQKVFFLGNEVIGELREEEIFEPDGGGDILGVPTWFELSYVVEILTQQGRKSFYPLQGLKAALLKIASKDTDLSRKVAEKYFRLLPTE